MSQSAPYQQANVRLNWIDAARGLAIVAVVFGHVWRGLHASAIITDDALFQVLDRLIYSFHMPLFFFLSGLVFKESQHDITRTLFARIVRLLWPLALWTWIYFSFKIIAGSLANSPIRADEFPYFPLPPREQFWFLWALLLVQFAVTITLSMATRLLNRPIAIALTSTASLALYLFVAVPEVLAPYVVGAVMHSPFFLAGMAYSLATSRRRFVGSALPYLALFTAAIAIALVTNGRNTDLVIGIVAAVALTTAMRILYNSGSPSRPLSIVRDLGLASMAIYVTHVIFTASTRIGLKMAGILDLRVHILLAVLAGVLLPLVIYRLAKRAGVTRIAGF